ncbi:MAG: phospholipase, partial [Pseudomonadota bacterium]
IGFSQGGCLALEAAARQGRPLHAVIGISSALDGTEEAPDRPAIRRYPEKSLRYHHGLDGLPAYLSCHEEDPHIPLSRVQDTKAAFASLGATVELRVKQGSGHWMDDQDVTLMRRVLNRPPYD